MPKLFKTVIMFDAIVVAEDPERARVTLLDWIKSGDISPMELTAAEIRHEREIRPRLRDAKPIVADDVSDGDFDSIVKGNTSIQLFEKLHTKKGPTK